jgi:hypothetical protein
MSPERKSFSPSCKSRINRPIVQVFDVVKVEVVFMFVLSSKLHKFSRMSLAIPMQTGDMGNNALGTQNPQKRSFL